MKRLEEDELKNIEKVIMISDSENLNIFDIQGRMGVLLDFFMDNPEFHSFVPFLKTYYLITRSVADKRLEKEEFFDDEDCLESLDADFARRYFEPMFHYLKTGEKKEPWKTYFEYCERQDSRPVIELLLGINAHINADLACSLLNQNYSRKSDYEAINEILKEEIPEVMKFLVFHEHDFSGIIGLVNHRLAVHEFRKTVMKWRDLTWENFTKAKGLSEPDKAEKMLKSQTEEVGREIIATEKEFKILHFYKSMKQANQLSVDLEMV